MGRVIAMASGCITTEVVDIVLGDSIHLDIAVPMIAVSIRRVVEQRVIGVCREAATSRGLLHTVTGFTDIMQRDQ